MKWSRRTAFLAAGRLGFLMGWLGCHRRLAGAVPHSGPNASGRSPASHVPLVSLAPNLTELVYALGAQERLVGRTRQCDYPPQVREKSVMGDLTTPNKELVLASGARLVLATEGNPRAFLNSLRSRGIEVVEFTAKKAGELPAAVEKLGTTLSREPEARRVATELKAGLERLSRLPRQRGRVLLVLEFEPLITVSGATWLGDLLTRAGWENVAHASPFPYPRLSREDVLSRPPDLVLVADASAASITGSAKERREAEAATAKKMEILFGKLGVHRIPRFVHCPVDVLLRPGPRLVEGMMFLERLSLRP